MTHVGFVALCLLWGHWAKLGAVSRSDRFTLAASLPRSDQQDFRHLQIASLLRKPLLFPCFPFPAVSQLCRSPVCCPHCWKYPHRDFAPWQSFCYPLRKILRGLLDFLNLILFRAVPRELAHLCSRAPSAPAPARLTQPGIAAIWAPRLPGSGAGRCGNWIRGLIVRVAAGPALPCPRNEEEPAKPCERCADAVPAHGRAGGLQGGCLSGSRTPSKEQSVAFLLLTV